MRKIVVFSGAGLSAESGIPTFRDSGGLWEGHSVEEVATPEGWSQNKKLVLDFYDQRLENIQACSPNPAHYALAELEDEFDVVHITQNIDDLLERAGCSHVKHVHGSIHSVICENHESKENWSTNNSCNYRSKNAPAKLGDKCPECQGQLRPDVVWFGEPVDMPNYFIRNLFHEIKHEDGIFIAIGTSGQVYPAALLIPFGSQVPHRYLINKDPMARVSSYDNRIGSASEEMKKLANELLESHSVG